MVPSLDQIRSAIFNPFIYYTDKIRIVVKGSESIEFRVDPRVYKDDPNCPYEMNLDRYVHTDDRFSNNYFAHWAIYRNDKRYEDLAFRKQQARRLLETKDNSIPKVEQYWIAKSCHREVLQQLQEEDNSSFNLNFVFRKHSIKLMCAQNLREYDRRQAIIFARMTRFQQCKTRANQFMLDLVDIPINAILDWVGDDETREGHRRREAARVPINCIVVISTLFFFQRLLAPSLREIASVRWG